LLTGAPRLARRAFERLRGLVRTEEVAATSAFARRQVLGQRRQVHLAAGVAALVISPHRRLAREAGPGVDVLVALIGEHPRHLAGRRLRPMRERAGVVRPEPQRRTLIVTDDLQTLR